MANLKALRGRITSVKSTQKITKAMNMVAAAKLRRAQDSVEASRPYAERMERVIGTLASGMEGRDDAPPLLAGSGADQRHLIVVATAERGLCGGFNANIAKRARAKIAELEVAGKEVQILCVGRKGRDALRRMHGRKIIDTIELAGVRNVGFEHASPIGQRLLKMFENGEFDVCHLIFSKFVSVLTQEPTVLRLIPAQVSGDVEPPDLEGAVYTYEPDEDQILRELLPRNISVQIFRGLLENAASEQGARMTAMDNATRNAGDMIDRLTLEYNRQRQAAITNELIEIISGAEAL
ncbi:F0F1 ATP synthase subunit gamma [Minwuia thermotolerans]|uniref:ATP synthase gamma chain n=1 Tax=Minwuia thermotolerans TaxID=2056226 RepID=A0A2M9FYQ1_9PROT|nr:F0F1 ATP synthase subunit gamma [Minwuia thermotolerans]PJK28587.1 F0F1 ATP synthase subunit gamma [Minwuia thermotolerans]